MSIKLLEESLFAKMKEGRDEMQQKFAESQNQQGKTDRMLEKVDRMHEQLEHVHEALAEITSFCHQPLNCNVDGDYLMLYSHYHMTPLHPPLFFIFWSPS
jgi:hypothetical protein